MTRAARGEVGLTIMVHRMDARLASQPWIAIQSPHCGRSTLSFSAAFLDFILFSSILLEISCVRGVMMYFSWLWPTLVPMATLPGRVYETEVEAAMGSRPSGMMVLLL
jgi:hypothetical protein